MSTRALRRHHRHRMVKRARELLYREGPAWPAREWDERELEHWAACLADNLAWCSCYSCGNPRRHHGFTVYSHRHDFRTRQEIQADAAWRDWEDEIG